MKPNKPIAALLLAVMPSTAFAQSLPSASLSQFNERVARASIVERFDPSVYSLDIEQVAPCDASKTQGRADAGDQHGTVGWFVGGIGAGVGLGLIGTGIILGGTALSSPKPATIKAGQEETCYRDGYKSKAKSKNLVSALLGGLVGTAVWAVIYLSNNNDN